MQLYPQSSDLYSDITAVTKAGKVRGCAHVGVRLSPEGARSAASESEGRLFGIIIKGVQTKSKCHPI